jgi:hypothetical protein
MHEVIPSHGVMGAEMEHLCVASARLRRLALIVFGVRRGLEFLALRRSNACTLPAAALGQAVPQLICGSGRSPSTPSAPTSRR